MKAINYKARPKHLTMIYQKYGYDSERDFVDTRIRKDISYGSAIHVFEANERNDHFISFYLFSEDGYEIVHYERGSKKNFYLRHFISYDCREYFRKRGFREYDL